MPCQRSWAHGDGKKTLVVLDDDQLGHVVVKAAEGVLGREEHWSHCPARERFKKQKPKPAQTSLF